MRRVLLIPALLLAACTSETVDKDTSNVAEMTDEAFDAMIEDQMADEPAFLDPATLSRDMFAPALVALEGVMADMEDGDMTALMTDVVVDHPGDAGVQQVFAGDGRTIVFMDETFPSGPVAARETYTEFLPVGPLSNRLEYTGARVKCRGSVDFQLEPCT